VLTGTPSVDPVARIDLGRRSRDGRRRSRVGAQRRRAASGGRDAGDLDPELLGATGHGIRS
jgi:hypothetical protein